MKKIFLSLSLTSALLSCSDTTKTENNGEIATKEKTAIELEDESMKSGKSKDTLSNGFFFGMTKQQVNDHCEKLASNNEIGYLDDGRVFYKFLTKNFIVANSLDFYYDHNGKLFRIVEVTLPSMLEKKGNADVNFKDEIFFEKKTAFGRDPLTNGTQKDAKFYWLDGDLRFDYLENEKTCYVSLTKISAERKIIAYNEAVEKELQKIREHQSDSIINVQREEEQSLLEKLKARAKKDWPDDYTTQEYWINEQIDAYHYMQTIPNDDKIKKKAQRDWPLDYITQKYWYNEQIDAKARLK